MHSLGHWLCKRTLINSGLCSSLLSSFNVPCGALSQYVCVSQYFAVGNEGSLRGVSHVATVLLRCLFLLLQQSPSLRMDRWRQQRLRRPWCEEQVTPLPSPARGPATGLCQGAQGGGWDGVAFLGSSLCSCAACCRFHPQPHGRLPGHHQPRADGGAVRSRQPGLRGQQLHQRCQPGPEHRLWAQPRGECCAPCAPWEGGTWALGCVSTC